MLTLMVPVGEEYFDDEKKEFFTPDQFALDMEHSLASLSKWESREEVPFLSTQEKTSEQVLAYVKDMVLTPNVPDEVYTKFTSQNMTDINNYINAKMTATWFRELESRRGSSSEVVTAELIFYWMVTLQIPFECQYWHLNRLITLVRVCNEKNKPSKKMPRQSAAQQQRELNNARRAKHGTRG